MPNDNETDQNFDKWGSPTSSYEDALEIIKMVSKQKAAKKKLEKKIATSKK